jgi:hypothetical protein
MRRWVGLLSTAIFVACASAPPIVELTLPPAPLATVQPAASAAASASPRRKASTQSFVGKWRETWGVEGETDVSYHDEMTISLQGGRLIVVCEERPTYQFSPAVGDGRHFAVHLENGGLLIDYDLKLSEDGQTLTGTAHTSSDLTIPITWERVLHDSPPME